MRTRCPNCDANLVGDPIPEQQRHHFGGKKNFMRTIGLYDDDRDMTIAWRCPDCGHEWPRTFGSDGD
jgi:hypothetical protein